ncbi:hypothetical protein [Bradyrhizobium sp. AZCC 2289]|uniref:hypothetical protein n=1 Tax=Bradyrhizobium sp. AZCC 2289 TaxID=3117026 RepID=UPI002FEFF8F1
MTRRNALASAAVGVASLSLTLQPSGGPSTRRVPSNVRKVNDRSDPFILALNDYRQAAGRLARAAKADETFQAAHRDTPDVFREPSIQLGETGFLDSHEAIDAHFDRMLQQFAERKSPPQFVALAARDRDRCHAELDAKIAHILATRDELGYAPVLTERKAAEAAEHKVLDQVMQTTPTTMRGVQHLGAFIQSILNGDLDIGEYQVELQTSLMRALERITGQPTPKVTPYFYNWDDVIS